MSASARPAREGRYLPIFDMKAAAARSRRPAAREARRAAGAAAIAAEVLSASRLVMSPRASPAGSELVFIRRTCLPCARFRPPAGRGRMPAGRWSAGKASGCRAARRGTETGLRRIPRDAIGDAALNSL